MKIARVVSPGMKIATSRVHEKVEVKKGTTGGALGGEVPVGPLMFQGDHGPVAFRNLKITPKK